MKSKIFNKIPNVLTSMYCVYLVIVVLLICTISSLFEHDLLRDYAVYSLIFFVIAVVIGLLFILGISSWVRSSKNKKITKFIVIGSIILFFAQLFIVYGKFFIAGWDVNILMLYHDSDWYYFSVYPNNLFLKSIIMFGSNTIKNIPNLIDFFISVCQQKFSNSSFVQNLDYQRAADCINYVVFVVLNCVLVNISVALTAAITNKLKNIRAAKIIYVFTAIFLGLMPWILVPYSDTFALFFTSIILYLYVCKTNKNVKWAGIIAATIIGFNIKPTVIFCLVAILFVELCNAISKYKKMRNINIKKYVRPILCTVIAAIICIGFTNAIKNSNQLSIDDEKQFTSTHFLMLGLNPESLGFWSENDVNISQNCQTIEEREEKNIEIIKQRIQDYGPVGLLKMCAKKSVINYSDGTFMWGLDGGSNFCTFQIGNNTIIKAIYDNYYYPAQIIWFIILIGCILCLFIKKKSKEINMIALTLLMLSIFIMIFECGSRYLILYLPYFFIMASIGWCNLSGIISKKIMKNSFDGT